MGYLKTIAIGVLLAYGCTILIRVFLTLDLNKRINNHQPGPCRFVEGDGIENGSEDMEFIPDLNMTFVSSGLTFMDEERRAAVKGQIFLYDFNKRDYKVIPLPIEGAGAGFDKTFSPHGMSSFSSNGRLTLYVVSHPPGGHTVEVFTFNKDKRTLTFVKTITDPLLNCPNDLVMVGADRFFITNYCYFYNKYVYKLEALLPLSLGSILYYDGKKFTMAENWSLSPNGIAVNANQTFMYVASPWQKAIRVYKLAKDMSIEKHADIILHTIPDNPFIDPKTADIWIGCHPIVHQLFAHEDDTKKTASSSSQVLRIRMKDEHKSWVISEPYANDGTTIRGSSSAIYSDKQMLVGTVFHKLLHCDVPNPDLV